MLSNKLSDLAISASRNERKGPRVNVNSSSNESIKSVESSTVEINRPSSTLSAFRYFRQSRESIISLMSSVGSTSGIGQSQSPLMQPRCAGWRFTKGDSAELHTSSAESSSRSSLTDGAGLSSVRGQIYRRSARNLSVKSNPLGSLSPPVGLTAASALPVEPPLSFEVPSIDAESVFVGRQWLFHELHEILIKPQVDNGMRGTIIYGGVGVGKTAVSHALSCRSLFHVRADHHETAEYANVRGTGDSYKLDYIFLRQDRLVRNKKHGSMDSSDSGFASSSYKETTNRSTVEWSSSVGDRLAAYHFCQIDSQVTCNLIDFLRNIVSMVAYNPYFSAYRDYLNNRRDFVRKSLNVIELSRDPAGVFRQLFTDPLNELKKCQKITNSDNRNYLILVDSLDEAEYHRPEFGDSITSFLVKHAETVFPTWMKLVLTIKTQYLDQLKGLRLHKINLDDTVLDERVYADAAEFVRRRISEGGRSIARNLVAGATGSKQTAAGDTVACPSTRFAEHLISVAKGNYLYLKLTLNLIEKSYLVMKGANYKALPVNLSEVFLLMFNLKFPTVRAYERVAPMLNVISASLYPLTARQIFEAVNSGFVERFVLWEEFCERLMSLQDYLVQRQDDTYVFFHPAFRDWLIRREDGQSPKFLCDLKNGHALLALRLCRNGGSNLSGESLQELGHHMLKAHLYKRINYENCVSSGQVCQLHWINLKAFDIKRSLCTARNMFSPNTKVSRLLLLAGADPNAQTDVYDNAPLLCVAARHGRDEFVSLLLEFGADADCHDAQGLSPLMHAALGGHLDAVQLLHQHGAKLSQIDNRQRCALVHAAIGGWVNVVSFLLQCDWVESYASNDQTEEEPARFSQVSKQQASQQAFVAAAEAGQTLVCQFLLDFGDAVINEPDPVTQDTALSAACLNCRKDTVSYLLRSGARVVYGQCGQPKPPLIQAVVSGCWEIVSSLLSQGIDVDEERNDEGETPLIVAAQNGHIGVLELLLSRGADVNAVDDLGRSALSWACISNKASCASLLLERNSKLDLVDKHGRAPYHYAAQFGDKRLIQLISDAASIAERPDADGLRPLEIAIQSRNLEAVQRLLCKGAKLSPVTWAVARNERDILSMLFNKLLDDGRVLYKKGRLEDAAHRFRYALKKLSAFDRSNRDFARARYNLLLNLARCERKSGDREAAIKLCTEATLCEPNETEAYYSRARCFYECQRFESARADLLRVLKTQPSSEEAADLLAKVSEKARASGASIDFKVGSSKNWERGSSDSGNIPDAAAAADANQLRRLSLAHSASSGCEPGENSVESEL